MKGQPKTAKTLLDTCKAWVEDEKTGRVVSILLDIQQPESKESHAAHLDKGVIHLLQKETK